MKKRIISIIFCIVIMLSSSITFSANEDQTPSGVPFLEIESFVDEYMSHYIGKTSPGAAVVLVKDDKIILSKGYGYADIENEILVDSKSTVFEYGSVSKLFVYTTIMRLWEQGKIDLEEDIRNYLPKDFLKKLKYDEPITMLHIMNHTTGFEDYLLDVILTSPKHLSSLEQTLKNSQPEQVYRPGTVSAYSNYAVALAAYISEQMMGQDFYEYLMQTVFSPLGMNNTSAHPTLDDKSHLLSSKAIGYSPQEHGEFKPGSWSYIPIYPCGSINGTAEDLARFAMALMPNDNELSPLFEKRETIDEMLTQSLEMGPGLTGFAHGFIEWDGEYRGVGHGGNTAAFTSQMNIVPEERFGVIILTNAANENSICSGLTEALIGKRNNTVIAEESNLPDVNEVKGTYISARRMHSGFLKFYNYLSLLNVKPLESNMIELSIAGQTGTYMQIRPYVYQRTDANGDIFKYHFGTIYFDVANGRVQRMSGDYLPLQNKFTEPLLIVSLIIAIGGSLYFLVTPVIILVRKLRNNKLTNNELVHNNREKKVLILLVLCGTAISLNNILMIIRMLINNFRSFAEMKIHVLLNYPITALAILFSIMVVVSWRNMRLNKKNKIFFLLTVIILLTLIILLVNWKFFNVIV